MRQERQHSELIHDVETFKPDQLKHADTKEKIILPNAKGITEIYDSWENTWFYNFLPFHWLVTEEGYSVAFGASRWPKYTRSSQAYSLSLSDA